MRPLEVVVDWLPRIEGAAAELEEAKQLAAAATQRRNELIVAATDAGIGQRAIAKAARIGQSRVIAILSEPLETEAEGDTR